jgi:homoserine kinase
LRIRAYAPATIGNFFAGFDVLGAALAPLDGNPWGDVVEASTPAAGRKGRASLKVIGPHAAELPADTRRNLVWHCLQLFTARLRKYDIVPAGVALTLHKNLPVCSGLGSSASSVVAALVALNAYFREPFSRETLLDLAGQAEARAAGAVHFDNVAPALLGGLQLVARQVRSPSGDLVHAITQRLPFFKQCVLVMVHPHLQVATARARRALPRALPLPVATAAWANLAALVHALHTRRRTLFADCLRDLVAEPSRAKLVRGFAAVQRAALEHGALGCTLSGSGPAVVAVTDSLRRAGMVSEVMTAEFRFLRVATTARLCHLDRTGARLI